ncbi:YybH family protein [Parasphingorhabdus sp.]|uniref:YybH family protein n=1 Tax=Parasphingorhabdus sp. TaxID=2709688 RepID=UPI003D2A9D66
MNRLFLFTAGFTSFMLVASTVAAHAHKDHDHNSAGIGSSVPGNASSPETVLNTYRQAIERLDGSAMAELFTEDSLVFENGKAEGSFANYLTHHLGPELHHVTSFQFTEPKVSVTIYGDTAVAHESYGYVIVLGDDRTIKRQGVATSVLRKTGGSWKIVQYHSSSRAPKK